MTRKDNPLLTASEVAQHCGLHPNTITGYNARRQMPAPDKQYGRTPLWRQTTIDNWRNNVTHPNAKPATSP